MKQLRTGGKVVKKLVGRGVSLVAEMEVVEERVDCLGAGEVDER